MSHATELSIDVVSDVMCPWCYIGKRRLEAAVAELRDVTVSVRWRPYQLDPTLPASGKDRASYLAEKFGGAERARTIYQRVEEAGAAEGILFAFDRIQVSPNTLEAHGLIAVAGVVERQDAMVERLFAAYFVEGRNLADRAELIALAEEAGLARELARRALHAPQVREGVAREVDEARRVGIDGVPFFIVDGRYGLVGAQPAAVIADALRQVAAAKRSAATLAADVIPS